MKSLPIPGFSDYRITQDGIVQRKTGPNTYRVIQSSWDKNRHYRIINLWQNGYRSGYMLHHLVSAAVGLSLLDARRCIYQGYHLTPGAKDQNGKGKRYYVKSEDETEIEKIEEQLL